MRISIDQLKWLTIIIPTGVPTLDLFAANFSLQDFLDTPVASVILIAVAAVAIFLYSGSRS